MRKPLTISGFTLTPGPRRSLYTVTCKGKPTGYSVQKFARWCLFREGEPLPLGRYARLNEALAAAVSHAAHAGRWN